MIWYKCLKGNGIKLPIYANLYKAFSKTSYFSKCLTLGSNTRLRWKQSGMNF